MRCATVNTGSASCDESPSIVPPGCVAGGSCGPAPAVLQTIRSVRTQTYSRAVGRECQPIVYKGVVSHPLRLVSSAAMPSSRPCDYVRRSLRSCSRVIAVMRSWNSSSGRCLHTFLRRFIKSSRTHFSRWSGLSGAGLCREDEPSSDNIFLPKRATEPRKAAEASLIAPGPDGESPSSVEGTVASLILRRATFLWRSKDAANLRSAAACLDGTESGARAEVVDSVRNAVCEFF